MDIGTASSAHYNARVPTALEGKRIEQAIVVIRGERVMLDADLAMLYRVDTRALIQAVKRNLARFPSDFMIRLTGQEASALRSQTVISNAGRGGRRYAPYAFTEQGVAMLSSVLRSPRAIAANVAIMRAFVRIRSMLSQNVELARRLDELERKYDARFKAVFEAIRGLMTPPPRPAKLIGFLPTRPGGSGSGGAGQVTGAPHGLRQGGSPPSPSRAWRRRSR